MSIVGIPVLVSAVWFGGLYFSALLAIIGIIGLFELFRICRLNETRPMPIIGIAGVLGVLGLFTSGRVQDILPFLILMVVIALLWEVFTLKERPVVNSAVTLIGILYIGVFLGTLIGIREGEYPAEGRMRALFVLSVFVGIWICDTSAYFFGMKFGRHRLFEKVSPKKSVEGAIAGFLGAAAVFFGVYFSPILPGLHLTAVLVILVIVGVFGQVGDLLESWLKRSANLKDSSTLIPGHGGVLDRFDSILLVAPLLYLAIEWNLL